MEAMYIYVIVGIVIIVIAIAIWWFLSQPGGALGRPDEPPNFNPMTLTWAEWWANKVVVTTQHAKVIYRTTDAGDNFYWALLDSGQIYISVSKANVINYVNG